MIYLDHFRSNTGAIAALIAAEKDHILLAPLYQDERELIWLVDTQI